MPHVAFTSLLSPTTLKQILWNRGSLQFGFSIRLFINFLVVPFCSSGRSGIIIFSLCMKTNPCFGSKPSPGPSPNSNSHNRWFSLTSQRSHLLAVCWIANPAFTFILEPPSASYSFTSLTRSFASSVVLTQVHLSSKYVSRFSTSAALGC